MARSRTLAALAAVLALAVPAAALADSAGDNQYQDPFANSQPKTNTAPTTTPTAPSTPPPSSTPAPATNTSAGVSTAGTTPAASNTSTDGQLPFTGLDLRLVGGIGVLLLAAGVLIRRRLA